MLVIANGISPYRRSTGALSVAFLFPLDDVLAGASAFVVAVVDDDTEEPDDADGEWAIRSKTSETSATASLQCAISFGCRVLLALNSAFPHQDRHTMTSTRPQLPVLSRRTLQSRLGLEFFGRTLPGPIRPCGWKLNHHIHQLLSKVSRLSMGTSVLVWRFVLIHHAISVGRQVAPSFGCAA